MLVVAHYQHPHDPSQYRYLVVEQDEKTYPDSKSLLKVREDHNVPETWLRSSWILTEQKPLRAGTARDIVKRLTVFRKEINQARIAENQRLLAPK